MKKLKFYLSILTANLIATAIKILNFSSGTSFVGLVILKICPDFLKYCPNYIKGEKITVTGTNGKTTTAGLLAHILEDNKRSVIHNEKGANMLTGVANVMALNILPFKRFDNCVIESDEAYLTKLYDNIDFDYLIVTNLFRDQLDRYGELDTTARLISEAIAKNPNLKLLLNANDPLVASFGENAKFFGFENVEFLTSQKESNAPAEAFSCVCGKPLKYSKRFFAQQGIWYCDCGYVHPKCDYECDAQIYDNYSNLKIRHHDREDEFKVEIMGLYNAYNALAAISLALELGIDAEKIKVALMTYKSIFGRAERKVIQGRQAIIQLIKNPAGASEVLKTVDLKSHVIIAINDNYADGRDMSWLWDADFELLKDVENPIVVSGVRARDMAVRLKYAGIPTDKIIVIPKIKRAIDKVANSIDIDERITILPSYTALLKIKKK